jgi:hypothetical protein
VSTSSRIAFSLSILAFSGAVALVMLMGVNVWQVRGLDSFVRGDATQPESITIGVKNMTTYRASWLSGGITIEVEVTCEPSETAAECRQRFADEVAAMLELFPRDLEPR